ncbi:hypothetical protein BDV95DRAFT_486313 [Massariosphaeria phaeospora]|uniref:Uncharacterized protein n=1 Tax=Massariosphaeria phaeospora TaxID=100035 RepID=A0A7C8IAH7_9PLEO|nr:hypothetical protein BDV95DRAFT_486313 [Massariosphaeria phaeospora]
MPREGTTTHHCPGRDCWVGDISPGGCRAFMKNGKAIYCEKHQMPCRMGCYKWYHLKSDPGCCSCRGKVQADDREERKEAEAKREVAKKNTDDEFFKQTGKARKPRKG